MAKCVAKCVGHLWLNGWGIYGKVSYCFLEDMLKNTGLEGSTLSSPHMTNLTMGFSPFELLTRGLLQKGQGHSSPV